MLIALNKPFQVLTQFTPVENKRTLADFVKTPGVYAAGRLDFDSEGLLLLTDTGSLQHALSTPGNGIRKRYWVQVEGLPSAAWRLRHFAAASILDGRPTAAAEGHAAGR